MTDKRRALAKPYEPTLKERTALDAQRDRRGRQSPAPRVKVSNNNGIPTLSPDHSDEAVGGSC